MNRKVGPAGAELVNRLRALRAEAGAPSLQAMARRSGASAATISRLLQGETLPSWEVVEGCIRTCLRRNVTDETLAEWRTMYLAARREREARTRRNPGLPIPDRGGHSWEQVLAEVEDVPGLQTALRMLLSESGLTMRDVQRRGTFSKSTISDALNRESPPTSHVVADIAKACGVPPAPWAGAADWLQRAALPVRQPDTVQPGPAEDLTGPLLAAAATRTPQEIARLARRLREGGRPELATRLLTETARSRGVDDVAAVGMALLDEAESTRPATENRPSPQGAEEMEPVPASIPSPANSGRRLFRWRE
ncbi:helix-turn-helix domain-containing protein [Streptomyces sp. NPDC046631]|uniref:helix-turn-helix domain-containing protein n=1 Tax=unclassified Streptomyces TaxID=2593676 RepID=UPI0033FEF5EA